MKENIETGWSVHTHYCAVTLFRKMVVNTALVVKILLLLYQ